MKTIEEIITLINSKNLTAYEISKEVPITEAGIHKLLKGESKLHILSEYLNRKYPTNGVSSSATSNIEKGEEKAMEISLNYSKREVINHLENEWREYLKIPAFQILVKAWANKLNEGDMLKEIYEIKGMLKDLIKKQ